MPLKRSKRILLWVLGVVLVTLALFGIDGYYEAHSLRLTPATIVLSRLPQSFNGMTCALIADVHRGPYVSQERVADMVARVNATHPDLIVLAGDYVSMRASYIEPCIAELGKLSAPMGVYAILGNHDHWVDASLTRQMLSQVGILDLTNTNIAIRRGEASIWLCGVGDLWTDEQDLDSTLSGVPDEGLRILLSHNPDYADRILDRNVDLVLSGHTHGGQICIPFYGPIVSSSRHPHKYAGGLVHMGSMQVFLTRGVGTIRPPVRLNCPAEVSILTLKRPVNERQDNPYQQ